MLILPSVFNDFGLPGEGNWGLHSLLGASGGDPGGDPRGQYRADPAYTNEGSAHETQNVHVTGPSWVHRL